MKRFLLFVAVATLFAACSKDAIDEQQGIQNIVDEAPATLTVGFEDDETRIQLNEAQKTVWTKGDLVSVFYRSDANQQWQYTGETGARTADLTRVDAGEATKETQRVIVVYPYNEDYYFNTETYNVQASLPATQTYLKDSYGLDGNIMVSSSEFNQFKLKTVYGWLKLQLTGAGEKIKSISLCGNDGEQVAGDVVINTTDATITLAADGDKSDATIFTEVTLDCGEGIELGAEATAFYIALPPQTFTKGLTVEITAIDGSAMTQSTDNEVVIERNHIKPMTALTFKATKPANNEIWYTTTDGAVAEFYFSVSNITPMPTQYYNEEQNCWVVRFDESCMRDGMPDPCGFALFTDSSNARITTLKFSENDRLFDFVVNGGGDWDPSSMTSLREINVPNYVTKLDTSEYSYTGVGTFQDCTSLETITLSNKLTVIGNNTFFDCSSLTSITIPDSVTTIGGYAFQGCSSLKSVTLGEGLDNLKNFGVFMGCRSLEEIIIPSNITEIHKETFQNCDRLHTIYCKRETPPAYGYSNLAHVNIEKIYVPASDDDSIIKAYKEASGWSSYKDHIFEEE